MLIERLEVVPYALPFAEPYVTSRGRLERRELVLVRLEADGLVGLGETAPLALRRGDALARIIRDLDRFGRLLVDTELDPRRWSEPAGLAPDGTSLQALAAVEVALLDLAGKALGEPAWRLLGADAARPLECNATLSADAPERVARQAQAWAERGFSTFKLKVGMEGDVDQVRAARGVLGAEAAIRVDANGAWDVDQAAERLAAMGPLELAEQPCETIEQLALLAPRTDVALAADESVVTQEDARAAAGVCRAATVKLAKVGGVNAALAIAEQLPVYMSSALEGPVGISAAAHAAQTIADTGLAHGLATELLFSATIGRGADLDGSTLRVPGESGLGVELDEDALARLAL